MLFTIFGVQLAINNIVEVLSPIIVARVMEYTKHDDAIARAQRAYARDSKMYREGGNDEDAPSISLGALGAVRESEVLREAEMASADDAGYAIFNDYNELTVQFG